MPTRSPRACAHPGCPYIGARCPRHYGEERVRIDRRRGSAAARGYGADWRRAREAFLLEHPLCECAEHRGREHAPIATVVDHIVPHRGNPHRFWDRTNWQALAKPCHDRKTAREDGRWGRRARPSSPEDGGGSRSGIFRPPPSSGPAGPLRARAREFLHSPPTATRSGLELA